jgi:hypothetical protein
VASRVRFSKNTPRLVTAQPEWQASKPDPYSRGRPRGGLRQPATPPLLPPYKRFVQELWHDTRSPRYA